MLCRLVVRAHTAQNNTLWSNVEYFHHRVCIFLLCGVQFTYALQLVQEIAECLQQKSEI